MSNQNDERVFSTNSEWPAYQMHVLSTLERLEREIKSLQSRYEIDLVEVRNNFSKDMGSIQRDIADLRSSLTEEVGQIKVQLRVADLEQRLRNAKNGIEKAKKETAIEAHLESSSKFRWMIWAAALGIGAFAIESLFKFIAKSLGF